MNDKNTENARDGQYGKFDTAEQLLSAYNALEAQFTKRCQLVKELQAELERSAQAAGTHADKRLSENAAEQSDALQATDEAQSETSGSERVTEQQATAKEGRDADIESALGEIVADAASYADALAAVPEIMDACIALYKQRRLCGGHLPVSHGAAVLTPVKRPDSLAEAKALADILLGM